MISSTKMRSPKSLHNLQHDEGGRSIENRSANQEWTIQRNWQHWVQQIQNEDKQKTQKTKKMTNTDSTITHGEFMCS